MKKINPRSPPFQKEKIKKTKSEKKMLPIPLQQL
jgi:hypothetical protein